MAILTITRGLPGSGKTTWARAEAARTGAVLVSRDDLRAMLHPGPWPHGDRHWEDICTKAGYGMVGALLAAGHPVICHDTNLDAAHLNDFIAAVSCFGGVGHIQIEDRFLAIPLDVCIERDAARPNPVGADVIRRMHDRHIDQKGQQ